MSMNARNTSPTKVVGADSELGNFLVGAEPEYTPVTHLSSYGSGVTRLVDHGTGYRAARKLLAHVPGIDSGTDGWGTGWSTHGWSTDGQSVDGQSVGGQSVGGSATWPGNQDAWSPTQVPFDERSWSTERHGYDPRDLGRVFLATNGGSIYIDLGHLELATPEVTSARDHVAAWHGMLRIAQTALEQARSELSEREEIHALVNNRDGLSNSYGSHMSFLMCREPFDALFRRRFDHLLYLASFLASGIIITGTGKVGAENDTAAADYQISQRADYFQSLLGMQTTYDRPLINSRDESHASQDLARLHVIAFDNSLCHGTTYLKVGCTQLILAMIESDEVSPTLLLEDPVRAMRTWSRDPDLAATSERVDGSAVRALDLQRGFHQEAARFVRDGRARGVVADAEEIVDYWGDTLARFESDPESLAGRLCWVLKRQILEQAREEGGYDWQSEEIKLLDQLYHSLDPAQGLYWEYEREGLVELRVSEAEVQRQVAQPPEDTRAYARAHLLRHAGAERVRHVDWSKVRVLVQGDYGTRERTVRFDDPCAFTRQDTEHIFTPERSLEAVVADLQAMESEGR